MRSSSSVPVGARPASVPALTITSEEALAAAILALSRIDPGFVAHMVDVGGGASLRRQAPGFEGLARIIVAQQVSVASAAAIFGRLLAAVVPFESEILSAMSDDALKTCGLSGSKIRTLRSIADAMLSGALSLDQLAALPADEALATLMAIRGIGPWTAEVFLLFCLGHADAWPAGDVALQEAARLALGLDQRPDAAALTRIGERWRPYRGAAAYLLWSSYRAWKNRDGLALRADRG